MVVQPYDCITVTIKTEPQSYFEELKRMGFPGDKGSGLLANKNPVNEYPFLLESFIKVICDNCSARKYHVKQSRFFNY